MRSENSVLRLLGAIVLCALAGVAVVLGGPGLFRLIAIGAFMIGAPGLVLVSVLKVRDPLLSLVVGMVSGPALWTMLAMVTVFVGWWWPGPIVLVMAVLVAAAAVALLLRELRTPANPLDDARHRFAAHLHDEVVLRMVGRHRGAFPFR